MKFNNCKGYNCCTLENKIIYICNNKYEYFLNKPIKFLTHFSRPVNYVDCVIAKILSQHIFSSQIALIGSLKGVEKAKLNDHVAKVGCITELTTTIVTNIGVTVKVRDVIFKNQIFTSKIQA